MNEELHMNTRRLPGRLTARQVAWELRLKPDDFGIPAVARLLPALNAGTKGVVRYWATIDVLAFKEDPAKLARLTREITSYWKARNARRRKPEAGEATAGRA